jgi:hypothetical protein
MTGRCLAMLFVVASAAALLACSAKEPQAATPADPCADPANRDSMNCKLAAAKSPTTDERYVYSYQVHCEKNGDRSRSINVTYRSAVSCSDARSQIDRGADPCAEFAAEKWPGWRTWKREPVYELESCD